MHDNSDHEEEIGGSEQQHGGSRWIQRLPFVVWLMRPVQMLLSFIILCLTGYVVRTFGGDFAHTFAVSMITFAWTTMLLVYIVITPLKISKLYNRWVHYIFEFLTLVVWIILFALLVNECQSFDAAEDAVADVLSTEEANAINSIPGQDSAIMGLRAATWLSGTNSSFIFLTLIACILGHVRA